MRVVWAQRQEELFSDGVVSPRVFDRTVDRLRDSAAPYQQCLKTEAAQRHVQLSLAGLLSHVDRQNAEEIAALVDVERLVIQAFIGTAPWDHRPLVTVLVGQMVERLGEPDGIIQIPSDLVVKFQGIDIIDVLLQLIRHPNGVHRSCHHRKSRGCGALNICSPVGYH
jgi:hypothetical protein